MIFEKVKGVNQDAFVSEQYVRRFQEQEKKLNDDLNKREKKILDDNKTYSTNHCKNSLKHLSKEVMILITY